MKTIQIKMPKELITPDPAWTNLVETLTDEKLNETIKYGSDEKVIELARQEKRKRIIANIMKNLGRA